MNAADRLRIRLDLTAPGLRAAGVTLWRPAGLRERYLDYLQVMHGVIRASVPLMAAAVRRCTEIAEDPMANALAGYLITHVAQEARHDEWLLQDLAAAGREPRGVLAEQPGVAVARLVGAQYYWIEHHHPIALLGYIAVLEGNQPPPWLGGRLAAETGLPRAAFRTLELHAVLDQGHRDDLDDLLGRLDPAAEHERALSVSALHTADALAALLHQISTRSEHLPRPAAPTRIGVPSHA